jgi:uncharacterized phiE125 gp8 family phage protein
MEELSEVAQAVSAEELKRARHLPMDAGDDEMINAYLKAAQAVVETACGRMMGQRQVAFSVLVGDWRRWWFPVSPVVSLGAIEAFDGVSDWETLIIGARLQMIAKEPQLIITSAGLPARGEEIRITAMVGYDVGKWPLQMTQAVILIAGEWYEAGIAPEGAALSELSFTALRLIKQVRYMRPLEFGGS